MIFRTMTREQQNKHWQSLTEEGRAEIIAKYNRFDTYMPEHRGLRKGYEIVFGKHNLNPRKNETERF